MGCCNPFGWLLRLFSKRVKASMIVCGNGSAVVTLPFVSHLLKIGFTDRPCGCLSSCQIQVADQVSALFQADGSIKISWSVNGTRQISYEMLKTP